MKKILISAGKVPDTQSLSSSWLNGFRSLGYGCETWLSGSEPAFDVFDRVQPDIFWVHSNELTRETARAIIANKETKIILFVKNWEQANEKEKELVGLLAKNGIQLAFNTSFRERIFDACDGWKTLGMQTLSCLPAADITKYKPVEKSLTHFSALNYIGCYEKTKEQNIINYIFPLLQDFDFKIYGYGNWPTANYLGSLNKDMFNTIVCSSKINLSVSHSHLNATTPSERIFKILACGKIPLVHQSCQAYKDLFPTAFFFRDKKELLEQIAFLLTTGVTDDYEEMALEFITSKHTYEHRIKDTLNILGVK